MVDELKLGSSTGIEPATSAFTERHSSHLSYELHQK